MRKVTLLFLILISLSLALAIEINLGVGADITPAAEQVFGYGKLFVVVNAGAFAFDVPFAQIWPFERKLEPVDPLLSYVGLNFKLPITILYAKAMLGAQIRGVLELTQGKITGWDLPLRSRFGLGISEMGLFLEGGLSVDFTPAFNNMNLAPYVALGIVF